MKRYTHYKVSLLIGLLSLNTLSSYVNTRQALGEGGASKRQSIGPTGGNFGRGWNGLSTMVTNSMVLNDHPIV